MNNLCACSTLLNYVMNERFNGIGPVFFLILENKEFLVVRVWHYEYLLKFKAMIHYRNYLDVRQNKLELDIKSDTKLDPFWLFKTINRAFKKILQYQQ